VGKENGLNRKGLITRAGKTKKSDSLPLNKTGVYAGTDLNTGKCIGKIGERATRSQLYGKKVSRGQGGTIPNAGSVR